MVSSSVFAAGSFKDPFKDDNPDEPWNIIADEIYHDRNADVYIASGNVIIFKKGKNLSADYVRFNRTTSKANAKGNVVMNLGQDIIRGSSIDVDLKSETGTIYDGNIFLKENNYHISGDSIEKTGENTYTAEEATVSTCDADVPAWKITGKKLKITLEGYGFINYATFWTKKLPVIYTPFVVFPAKVKRQSGFLAPEIAQSIRKGIEYNQPYFWAINENTDATFYSHYMSERGEQVGFEYRYILSPESKGTIMYDYLNDSKIDDGTASGEKWGYSGDAYFRPNSDRYWFRMKADHAMPYGFNAKLDLDIVSDQDYLNEFKDGYNGFGSTEKYFNKYFGREIDDYDDPIRVNSLNFSKNWSSFTLNAEARWYDNVVNRRWNNTDDTLQKLPFIEFRGLKQQLFETPFYTDLYSGYTDFYRQDGVTGQRIDVYPRFYLPYRYKNYFSFEPSIGLRQTSWYIDQGDNTIKSKAYDRELYDIKLDLSTELFRIIKIGSKYADSIKHSIKPQIIYTYLPDKDQSGYPNFDSIDRIARTNLITYSVINTFTLKSLQETLGLSDGKKAETPSYLYNDFLRIKLEQSYDINEEQANPDNPQNFIPQNKPLSPIYGELKFTPVKYLSLSTDANWSTYDSNFINRNISGSLSDDRGDSVSWEYRFQRGFVESLFSTLNIKVFEGLLFKTNNERDIRDGKRIRTNLGFLYTAQCWSIDFLYTDEDNDKKFSFLLNFTGLGGTR
uniref:Uncharacterized protein n=1 Tax=uncultured Desulfobacterium sp. TaxID=201089 RepID=E1YCQ8_9BACT|nr:hypothetical protein N47_G36760 [uncultured Desulfobacterium sp.]